MDSLLGVAALAGVIFAALAALSSGYVWIKRAGETATIQLQDRRLTALTGENADLTRRVEFLERENTRLNLAVTQVQGVDKVQATVTEIKQDTTVIRARVGG